MSFKTITNYKVIYRYLFLICPKPYIIYLIISIIIFSLLEYPNIAWNIVVLILLFIVGIVLKKKICGFVIERYMDLNNERELHGKIVFSNEVLIQTFENGNSEEYRYDSFKKMYSLKKIYLFKTIDHKVILVDRECITPEEQVSIIAAVKAKMPQIKIIGGEKR